MRHRHTLTLVGILFLLGATSAADRRDAFLHAAAHGDLATVQALLAKGVDIEAPDAFDRTALMLAAQQ